MRCGRWGMQTVARTAALLTVLCAGLGECRAAGCFVRFRVDRLPETPAPLSVTATLHVHVSPWSFQGLKLTPQPVRETGWTPWVDLGQLPGKARGSLVFVVPEGVAGITRLSTTADDADTVRDIDWNEPDGTRIILQPGLTDVRTFREQERRYYLRTLEQTNERLGPLARPPLFFGNAWGRATGPAAEYMVKSFRLMGLNCVGTDANQATYETLYGWQSQDAQYQPKRFLPFDEEASLAEYRAAYKTFFASRGSATPNMRVFQLSDEPREIALNASGAADKAGFRRWLAEQGLQPADFEAANWDGVDLLLARPPPEEATLETNRRFYWSRRYQAFVTPRMFALAAQAVRESGPCPNTQSFVALSGHALYMPSTMPLDMFELARYPGLMPGISDWMTGGSWNWDGHQAVAFSVAPYNAGARRYGDAWGGSPASFPMMHCVNPTVFRALTQLANQCKFISYYTYGPDYLATEGFWSDQKWAADAVQHVNNQAALVDDILGPGTMRPSRVAMLYSRSQEIWRPRQTFPDKRATFLALAHVCFQPELVTEEQIAADALDHYDALFVLDQFVSRKAQARIEKWVQGGGVLWADADSFIADEYNQPSDFLERVGGLKRVAVTSAQSVQFVPRPAEAMLEAHEVPPADRFHKIPIRTRVMAEWPGATVRADYSDGHPAYAEKALGKGKLVYVGHRVGCAYSRRAGARGAFRWWLEGYREALTTCLFEGKVERELIVSKPLVMNAALSTDDGTVVILFDMNRAENSPSIVTVSLQEPMRPHSVHVVHAQGLEDVPFEYTDGRMTLTDWELPGGSAMLVVRRSEAPPDDREPALRARVTRFLASSDWQTVSAGAWFAGFFPHWEMGDAVMPLLGHEHWAVRRSAAEALGRLRHAPAGRVLRQAIDTETDAHALADILFALVRLAHPDAGDLVRKYAEDRSPFLRAEAARHAH